MRRSGFLTPSTPKLAISINFEKKIEIVVLHCYVYITTVLEGICITSLLKKTQNIFPPKHFQ
jgi:hypothetical protein